MENIHASEWIAVPQSEINKPERYYTKKGAGFNFMISPSDIPVAFRVVVQDQSKTLTIEFKYLSSPEGTEEAVHCGVRAVVGEKTRKIYRLTVDLEFLVRAVQTKVQVDRKHFNAIPALSNSVDAFESEGSLRSGNADAIKRLIHTTNNYFHIGMTAG